MLSTFSDEETLDQAVLRHCQALLARGIYPSIAALKSCRGLPRNGDRLIDSRDRLLAAGKLQFKARTRSSRPSPPKLAATPPTPTPTPTRRYRAVGPTAPIVREAMGREWSRKEWNIPIPAGGD